MTAARMIATGLFLVGAAVLVVGILSLPPAIIAGAIIIAASGAVGIMSVMTTRRRQLLLRPA